jgi:hypothetical protein
MNRHVLVLAIAIVGAAASAGCEDDPTDLDFTKPHDAGAQRLDGGPSHDAGAQMLDGGPSHDAGDAGSAIDATTDRDGGS